MGTAGLKIKFIPIMKDFDKDSSQCCLEIVPEISDIQNIDQIEWKNENNLIEYTIPMTYKIILQKLPRQTFKEINENLNKIYYSCVDLLLPSSITKFNLASGDVKRIISDTYVVTKIAANLNHTDDMQKLLLNLNELKNIHGPTNKQNSIDEDPFKEQINDSFSNNDETREDIDNHNEVGKVLASEDASSLNTVNINRNSIDKITNTESDFALCIDACTQSGETITCISTNMNSTSKANSRTLSQTPVCSIDADIIKENVTPNSVIYYFNEVNKETACIANICTINNIYNENVNKYKLFTKQKDFDLNYTNEVQNFSVRKRILPEIRVAELVQVMEKEIMPLKIMLNELLCKCATLGTEWKKSSHISLMYKTIDSNFNDHVAQCCKKHIKSNRVVYSIVFDG
ncbi:uncharacterized protein LOC115440602 isoform X2 [Manduca sexta]|uniref:uncharacterized protein LOC115440602 isoform X2 n=1 Tax=Manduca sexta TaxID=7130 RepID=UPI0011836B4A|nr:uncharacterized protein LOC115440602 isoform X2 [Manduca sexta]